MGYDHVCLAVRLKVDVMNQNVLRLKPVIPISIEDFPYHPPQNATLQQRESLRQEADESFQRHWRLYDEQFQVAIANKDVKTAH